MLLTPSLRTSKSFLGHSVKKCHFDADLYPMDRSFDTDLTGGQVVTEPGTAHTAVQSGLEAQEVHPEQLGQLANAPTDAALQSVPDRPNTGDRRQPRDDRRGDDDRRSHSMRRGRDRQRNAAAKQVAYLGTVLCALSVAVAIYAFLKPPINFTPSLECADGFGGQRVERRGLSALWALVMVLAVAGVVIPDRKRRPLVLLILSGVSVGLFVAAYFTVGTKLTGLCLV
jgi:hypothetical protein